MKSPQLALLLFVGCYALCEGRMLPTDEDGEKIVGGAECHITERPYQVSLRYKISGILFCGGSIYDENNVITAAHCCDGVLTSNLIIRAGDYSQRDDEGTEQEIDVAEIIMHEEYNLFTHLNDICILRLETPIALDGNTTAPATLPGVFEEFEGVGRVSGWGTLHSGDVLLPDLLQCVDVPLVADEECNAFYEDDDIVESMMCAGDLVDGGEDSCQGDSGGPMTCGDDVFCGVVSFGIGCALPEYPGVYTQVSYYIDWITSTAA